jgi:hypothetical protein
MGEIGAHAHRRLNKGGYKFRLEFPTKAISSTTTGAGTTYVKSGIVYFDPVNKTPFPFTFSDKKFFLSNQLSQTDCSITTNFSFAILSTVYIMLVDKDGADMQSMTGYTEYANYSGVSGPCIRFIPPFFDLPGVCGFYLFIAAAGVNPTVAHATLNSPLWLRVVENTFELRTGFNFIAYRSAANVSNLSYGASPPSNLDNYLTIYTKGEHGLMVGDTVDIVGCSNAKYNRTASYFTVDAVPAVDAFSFYQFRQSGFPSYPLFTEPLTVSDGVWYKQA